MDEIKKAVKPSDTRIVFGHQGRHYKFMSFISDKANNTLYFRLYRKPAAPESAEESDIIRIQLPESDPPSSEGGKLSVVDDSLTQSKIIKRKRHSAYGNHSVLSGTNITILEIAPQHPSRMVEISAREERDIHFALQGDVQPFVVNFIVHRKSSEEMPLADRNDLMGGSLMQCRFEGLDFDLLITMSRIKAEADDETMNWPPHSVVSKRIGN